MSRQSPYPPELRRRAVRMVDEVGDQYDTEFAAITAVAQKLGIGSAETLRKWEGVMDVTLATIEWVAWYNTERLHSYCGGMPPKEYEESFYKAQDSAMLTAGIQAK